MRRSSKVEYLPIFRRLERMLQRSMYLWRHKPPEFKSHVLRTQADEMGNVVSAYAKLYADALLQFTNDSEFDHRQISGLFGPRRSELLKECFPWHKIQQYFYDGERDACQKSAEHRNAPVVATIALVSGLFIGFLCGLLFF